MVDPPVTFLYLLHDLERATHNSFIVRKAQPTYRLMYCTLTHTEGRVHKGMRVTMTKRGESERDCTDTHKQYILDTHDSNALVRRL